MAPGSSNVLDYVYEMERSGRGALLLCEIKADAHCFVRSKQGKFAFFPLSLMPRVPRLGSLCCCFFWCDSQQQQSGEGSMTRSFRTISDGSRPSFGRAPPFLFFFPSPGVNVAPSALKSESRGIFFFFFSS